MNYLQKYLKYKNKYFKLKQFAGNPVGQDGFYPQHENKFSVYSVTKNPLTEEQKQELLETLQSTYGAGNVTISANTDFTIFNNIYEYQFKHQIEDFDSEDKFYRSLMIDFIKSRYSDNDFNYIVEFVITNTSFRLKHNHYYNDGILTIQEGKINPTLLKSFSLSDISLNPQKFKNDYDHGWGLAYFDEPHLLLPVVLNSEV